MESWRIDLPALTMCLLGDYTLFECSSFTLDNTPALKTLLCFDFAVYSCQTFVAIGTVLVGAVRRRCKVIVKVYSGNELLLPSGNDSEEEFGLGRLDK